MHSKTCIIVSGPTAVGKTSYAIDLALQYQTEIISADSRQCFKELNIGVAKPSADQLGKVKHYFINSHSIFDTVNAKVFEEYALESVYSIFKTNDVAIMVGGTGLYIKAFCEGFDEVPEINEEIRKHVFENYQTQGASWLQSELEKKDLLYFQQGEMKNPQRMMRALEVILSTGSSIYNFHKGEKVSRDFNIRHIFLDMPREELYANINNRVDVMMYEGLLDEAKSLYPFKHLNALQTVGYKELFAHIDGDISLENAIDLIKKNTRHYAKRQNTWFKKFIPQNQ
ncbi:MAG: tRNA (adenosine(37)-N6)-dimethylallyltransferase MiaA [Ginsengibacter sp.]